MLFGSIMTTITQMNAREQRAPKFKYVVITYTVTASRRCSDIFGSRVDYNERQASAVMIFIITHGGSRHKTVKNTIFLI